MCTSLWQTSCWVAEVLNLLAALNQLKIEKNIKYSVNYEDKSLVKPKIYINTETNTIEDSIREIERVRMKKVETNTKHILQYFFHSLTHSSKRGIMLKQKDHLTLKLNSLCMKWNVLWFYVKSWWQPRRSKT
jgi:hypothetical protein